MEKKEISTEEAIGKLAKRDRYLGVLWERLEGKISTVIEGNNTLERKIDQVDAKLENFKTEANEKFEMLFGGQDELKDRIGTLNGRVGTLEGGMKHLLEDNQEFFGELRIVKTDVATLDRRVTRLEQVEQL